VGTFLILVDAGPLVAIMDVEDQHHKTCVATLRHITEPVATVWPPLVEAFHLVSDIPNGPDKLWGLIERAPISLLPLGLEDAPRMQELMRKYKDRPMDLADAALIRVAERENIDRIFTVDKRHFSVYRLHGKVPPTLVP
jgi:uncharacterized protein